MKEKRLIEIWERQPHESAQAFEAFAIYRDMGVSRTVTAVGRQLAKSRQLIDRWKQLHHWEKRAIAWDNEQDRATREALIKGIASMRKNHVDIATGMLIKAAKALQKIPAEEMTMQDIIRSVDVATKLERISRGEPTERTESKTELSGTVAGCVKIDPYETLTTEELRALLHMSEKKEGAGL